MKLQELGMILSFGTAAFLFGGAARSADTAASAESAKVLNKLHHSNQMEIAAGKLALKEAKIDMPETGRARRRVAKRSYVPILRGGPPPGGMR